MLDYTRDNLAGKSAYLLLYFGIIALVSSIIYDSSVLAFIGLGLLLWGGLFLYIKPTRYVKSEIMSTAVTSLQVDIDEILRALNFEGKAVHIPSKTLDKPEGLLYIPKSGYSKLGAKQMSEGKEFRSTNGIVITDPGQGLLTLYEQRLGTNFARENLAFLKQKLPEILIASLELVGEIEITGQGDNIHVRTRDSVFDWQSSEYQKHQLNDSFLGCPLSNSLACAFAKVTGKPVLIEKRNIASDGKTTDILFRVINN